MEYRCTIISDEWLYCHAVLGCEAIISGPLAITGDGIPHLLLSFNINGTHPALVRCHVTCLNQQGVYNPAMVLIITSQERFTIIPGSNTSSRDGLYEIYFRGISSCEAQNNYTMEFEYLIYSNSSDINRAVLQCGVVHPHTNPPCWGSSYGIIRYYGTMTTTAAATTILPPPTTIDSMSSPGTSSVPSTTTLIIGLRGSQLQSGLISLAIILAIAMVICIPVSFVLGKRSWKKNLIVPTNSIEVISNMKYKEEELQVEQAGHIQNWKLPNTISSQDTSSEY